MRRSSIWFLIACLWLVDVLLTVVRGHARQAWLPAVVTAAFAGVGIVYRSRESRVRFPKSLK
jgi:hypothetical protein